MKALALFLLGIGAAHADAITYSFLGMVTSASGNYATFNGFSLVGDAVTGTYTINYGASIPAQSSGVPGRSPWVGASDYFAGDFPTDGSGQLVFTSTAEVLGTTIAYATTPPDPGFNVGSYVEGQASGSGAIVGSEQANQANGGNTQSFFEIGSTDPVFDAAGGPVYPPSAFGIGDFAVVSNGGANTDSVAYSIISVTPVASTVPLPSSVWLMLSGLVGLLIVARKGAMA